MATAMLRPTATGVFDPENLKRLAGKGRTPAETFRMPYWRRSCIPAACRRCPLLVGSMAIPSNIHDIPPDLTCASCVGHSTVLHGPSPRVICQATAPNSVHGVCQVVLLDISGQMILRPAPHMPVNSRHRSQNPSLAATRSRISEPQAGHAPTLGTTSGASRRWRRTLSLPRSSPRQLVLEMMRPT
jgi:hypothetical protein